MNSNKIYPLSVSIIMLAVGAVFAFVDVAFLGDVIAKVLDFETMPPAYLVGGIAGLAGMWALGHLGLQEGHGIVKGSVVIGHYILWIFVGLIFAIIRVFSTSIIQLADDNVPVNEFLSKLLKQGISTSDVVFALLMFGLFLLAGVLAKDGVKNLVASPAFAEWLAKRKEAKDKKNATRQEKREYRNKLKELMRRTGALRLDCEKVLSETNGDVGKAVDILTKDGKIAPSDVKRIKKEQKRKIKELARRTNKSRLEIEKALSETSGDVEKAMHILVREATPAEKAREAAEKYKLQESQFQNKCDGVIADITNCEILNGKLENELNNLRQNAKRILDTIEQSRKAAQTDVANHILAAGCQDDLKVVIDRYNQEHGRV